MNIEREKLEQLGKMLRYVIHEMATPLSALLLLNESLSDKFESKDEKLINIVGRQRKLILQLSQILTTVREQSLLRPLVVRHCSVDELIEHLLGVVKHRLDQNNILFDFRVKNDFRGDKFFIDVQSVSQVLVVLVNNAIDALKDLDQDISKSVMIKFSSGGNFNEIAVFDSGPGVSPEIVEKIFNEQFSSKSQGFGVGLSIARALIESFGGQLEYVNDKHESCFRISIPLAG